MSNPIHVIVTLSPETIEALVAALRPPAREPAALYQRPPYGSVEEPLEIGPALAGRTEVTVRELCDALGIDEARRTRPIVARLGYALRDAGWVLAGQRGRQPRERFYRRASDP